MIDRRHTLAALLAGAGILASRAARAETAMSRITAYGFAFPALKAATSASPTLPASRCWW